MSMTDYRRLIDVHGGTYIGIECHDGTTIEIGVNGDTPLKITREIVLETLAPRLRERMRSTLGDGFSRFEFAFGRSSIELNYYDAGQLLDALIDCANYLR